MRAPCTGQAAPALQLRQQRKWVREPGTPPPRAQPPRVAASPAREPDRPASCPQGAMEQAELGSVLPSGHLHPAHNFCSVGFFQKS